MSERTIKNILKLEGVEQYRAEIKDICADLKCLREHFEAADKSITQLNKSLKELIELRKQVSL